MTLTFQEKVSNELYKSHGLFVEVFFIAILLIFYFQYIFPLLEIIPEEQEDPIMFLTIVGFVWFSLILFVTIFPFTLISPFFIYSSASLREQSPEFAIYLFSLISSIDDYAFYYCCFCKD